MITLTILLIITLLCILVGCLMGLFSLVGVIASLVAGVLVGALAGYVAGRFMGTETSLGRNILMGILGSFVGEFVFGLFGIYATGSITSFIISVIGACICIWVGQKLFALSADKKPSWHLFWTRCCVIVMLQGYSLGIRIGCYRTDLRELVWEYLFCTFSRMPCLTTFLLSVII